MQRLGQPQCRNRSTMLSSASSYLVSWFLCSVAIPNQFQFRPAQSASGADQFSAQDVRAHLRRQRRQVESHAFVTAGIVAADRLGLGDADRRKLGKRRREIVALDSILQFVRTAPAGGGLADCGSSDGRRRRPCRHGAPRRQSGPATGYCGNLTGIADSHQASKHSRSEP